MIEAGFKHLLLCLPAFKFRDDKHVPPHPLLLFISSREILIKLFSMQLAEIHRAVVGNLAYAAQNVVLKSSLKKVIAENLLEVIFIHKVALQI